MEERDVSSSWCLPCLATLAARLIEVELVTHVDFIFYFFDPPDVFRLAAVLGFLLLFSFSPIGLL